MQQMCKKYSIPGIGNAGQAPVNAISILQRIGLLLVGQQFASWFSVNRCVAINSVSGQLSDVYYCHGEFHPLQNAGDHAHHLPVRSAPPVRSLRGWFRFVKTFCPVLVSPIHASESSFCSNFVWLAVFRVNRSIDWLIDCVPVMNRGHCGEENFCCVGIDIWIHPICPCFECYSVGNGSVQFFISFFSICKWTPAALYQNCQILEIWVRNLWKVENVLLHWFDPWVTHPPDVSTEHKDVHIFPVFGMLLNWINFQNSLLGVCHYVMIWVGLY